MLALVFDVLIREPPGVTLNPVVFMGNLVDKTWRKLKHDNPLLEKASGLVYTVTTVTCFTALAYFALQALNSNPVLHVIISALILKYCFSVSAFFDTVQPVQASLKASDLTSARMHVTHLVTRDTSRLNEAGIVSATVESISENLSDALVSPLFYYAFFGVPGAVACRIINLMDGILGHKTSELINFGWFPARFDDLIQFIPARLTGLLITASAFILHKNGSGAFKVMIRDHGRDDGVNSGWSIAAMAGALNVRLTRTGSYEMGDCLDELSTGKIRDALFFIPSTLALIIISSILVRQVIHL